MHVIVSTFHSPRDQFLDRKFSNGAALQQVQTFFLLQFFFRAKRIRTNMSEYNFQEKPLLRMQRLSHNGQIWITKVRLTTWRLPNEAD